MINNVTLIGNLGDDPEVRRLENGAVVARLSLATTESWKDKTTNDWVDETQWHKVVLWRYNAERAETQLKKGSQIYLEGKITYRTYEKQDGTKGYSTEIVGNTFRLLNKDRSTQNDTPVGNSEPVNKPEPEMAGASGVDDGEDLPF